MPGEVGDGATQTLTYTKGDGSTRDRADARRRQAHARTRCAASWSARRTARSPASPKRPTARRISSTSSTRARPSRKANVADPTKYLSHWPGNAGYGAGGANARPRSATIVITRNDGGLIGADGPRSSTAIELCRAAHPALTASARRCAVALACPSSRASTMTRSSGSVPLARIRMRPCAGELGFRTPGLAWPAPRSSSSPAPAAAAR